MAAAKRDVVVFLAHFFDLEVERRFLKLQRECSRICGVTLFVESGTSVPERLQPFAHFYDFSTLKSMASSVIGDGVVPGNCHLRSLDYFERFPGHQHYWFVEDHVVYTGNWGAFIADFAEDETDLLAARIQKMSDIPNWYWRRSISSGDDLVPEDAWVRALLPIHRISACALQALATKVSDGWTGHFEALVPSALVSCGLSIADLGGNGAWTPKGQAHRHYLDSSSCPYVGTIRHRPPIRRLLIRNMLHHPCKTSPLDEEPSFRRRMFKALKKRPALFIRYWLMVLWLTLVSRLRVVSHMMGRREVARQGASANTRVDAEFRRDQPRVTKETAWLNRAQKNSGPSSSTATQRRSSAWRSAS